MTRRHLLARLLLGLALVLVLGGCRTSDQVAVSDGGPTPTPTIQPDDMVDLTVYFRAGNGAGARLEPVTREVPVSDDLPRTALELLLEGPAPDDGHDLVPVVPGSTRLLGLEVDGGVATVDLSSEVVADAEQVGASPRHEVLALAAVANTLTEFPGIERVQVLVEGQVEGWHNGVDVENFWGAWGLPAELTRDESVVGDPREGDEVPDLALFSTERQSVGSREAAPVSVSSVRARERTTYVRMVVELVDGRDEAAPAAVVAAHATPRGDDLVLEVDDVVGLGEEVGAGQRIELGSSMSATLSVAGDGLPGTVVITVEGGEAPAFHLHTLSSPTRIVLDIRK